MPGSATPARVTPLAEVPVPGPKLVEKPSATDGVDPILNQARQHASSGDLSRALHAYSHLIRRGKVLADVTTDLARLIKKYPREAQVWQTLGDALTRRGDADHAAQSYEQAQKLKQ